MNFKQKINEDVDGIFTALFVTLLLLSIAIGTLVVWAEEILSASSIL